MKALLARYKPGASVRTHLMVTALIWSLVGLFLMVRAERVLLVSGNWMLLATALIAGSLKSYWVLDRVARKNIQRTLSLKDGACIGGAYSWRTWMLVLAMILLGVVLRILAVEPLIVGFLYMAIGWALYWSSRLVWQKWQKM